MKISEVLHSLKSLNITAGLSCKDFEISQAIFLPSHYCKCLNAEIKFNPVCCIRAVFSG